MKLALNTLVYEVGNRTREKLEIVSKFDGVEMEFPYENTTPEDTSKMKEFNLNFAAINVNIKLEAEWVTGALT